MCFILRLVFLLCLLKGGWNFDLHRFDFRNIGVVPTKVFLSRI